jgi:hypothetical protein
MCEPLYRGLVEELGDPEQLAREFDEWVIAWHAARMRAQAQPDAQGRHGSTRCA